MSLQSLGRWGETVAAGYLQSQGYELLARNVRTPHGEIDLVVTRDQQVVFVEVKTRAGSSLGPPEISVSARKQAHMRRAAQAYIVQHPELGDSWRLDVIAVRRQSQAEAPEVLHFENAVL